MGRGGCGHAGWRKTPVAHPPSSRLRRGWHSGRNNPSACDSDFRRAIVRSAVENLLPNTQRAPTIAESETKKSSAGFLGGRSVLGGNLFLRFNHFAAANAGRAYPHALRGTPHPGMHRTQIYIPASLGDVVGVADSISRLRLLAADITLLCHDGCTSFQILLAKPLFYRIPALPDNSPKCPTTGKLVGVVSRRSNKEEIYVESWQLHSGRKRTGLGLDGDSRRGHRRPGSRSGNRSQGFYLHHRPSLIEADRAADCSPMRYCN